VKVTFGARDHYKLKAGEVVNIQSNKDQLNYSRKSSGIMRHQVVSMLLFILISWQSRAQSPASMRLPDRGVCAHRGAMSTHPENTLSAFKAAIESGAHMIEFDVHLTKDSQLVVIHDYTVDRTTDGQGQVADLTLDQIKELDAGSHKSAKFAGERVPTLAEALEVMPVNIWLNVHLKGSPELAMRVARVIAAQDRLHQSFLACGMEAAKAAKSVVPEIMICNMDRRETVAQYVEETINGDFDFIQIPGKISKKLSRFSSSLRESGVRINFVKSDVREEYEKLYDHGIQFILCDDVVNSIKYAEALGIDRHSPVF
tara:strand:- start:89404 stop:90345 length:942 start_codon:yes stop_codon:yes gene_type:complete